jgi:hypothetical protein
VLERTTADKMVQTTAEDTYFGIGQQTQPATSVFEENNNQTSQTEMTKPDQPTCSLYLDRPPIADAASNELLSVKIDDEGLCGSKKRKRFLIFTIFYFF